MKNYNYHVYKKNNKWVIKNSYSKRSLKTFEKKSDAVTTAISFAKKNQSNAIIHKNDMKVSKMYKYERKDNEK